MLNYPARKDFSLCFDHCYTPFDFQILWHGLSNCMHFQTCINEPCVPTFQRCHSEFFLTSGYFESKLPDFQIDFSIVQISTVIVFSGHWVFLPMSRLNFVQKRD